MTVRTGVLLALMLGALMGCRVVVPAAAAVGGELGQACTAALSCNSGFCVHGVCCESACGDAAFHCATPEAPGRCVAKRAGARCNQAQQCPDSAPSCTDGVCCNRACDGVCESCDQPGSIGVCTSFPDNTDPQQECGAGDCTSCVAGRCQATAPNLDPENACLAGQTCNGLGTCAQQSGEACERDDQCALGRCMAGRCRQVRVDVLPITLPVAALNTPSVIGASHNEDGLASLVLQATFTAWNGTDFEVEAGGSFVAAVEQSGGTWRTVALQQCIGIYDSASVARASQMTMVVVATGVGSLCVREEGVIAYLLGPGGEVLGAERIWDQDLRRGPGALTVTHDGTRFSVIMVLASGQVVTRVRAPAGGWEEGPDPGLPLSDGLLVPFTLGGVTGYLDTTEDFEIRLTMDGASSRVPIPPVCLSLWQMSVQALAGNTRALVAYSCNTDRENAFLEPPGVVFVDHGAPAGAQLVNQQSVDSIQFPPNVFFSANSASSAVAVLEEGRAMFMETDAVGNVWLVEEQADGSWKAHGVDVYDSDPFGASLRASNLVTARQGSRGVLAYWTQSYFRRDDPGVGVYDAILMRATITP